MTLTRDTYTSLHIFLISFPSLLKIFAFYTQVKKEEVSILANSSSRCREKSQRRQKIKKNMHPSDSLS